MPLKDRSKRILHAYTHRKLQFVWWEQTANVLTCQNINININISFLSVVNSTDAIRPLSNVSVLFSQVYFILNFLNFILSC